jgi:UDP-glucuronate 4-epimerase
MKVLVTGAAGFIGFHVAQRLLQRGDEVVGLDNLNDYYDPSLKEARVKLLEQSAGESGSRFGLVRANIADLGAVNNCFAKTDFDRVIHLAAQAGVRYSIENPHAYVESNLVGFTNILEACRHASTPHLTYASTSSVYGANTRMPFSEHQGVDHPLQFYAATKRANELMAHSYSHLFGLPTTGLRFFTVYGPWGRPDMAFFSFTQKIMQGLPIPVFNRGKHTRDFTYVDDIAEGVLRASDQPASSNPDWNSVQPDPATSSAPHRVFNVGNQKSVQLLDYISALEAAIGKKAILDLLPLQAGDVADTCADTIELERATGYKPRTSVEAGVSNFVEWYRNYYDSAP